MGSNTWQVAIHTAGMLAWSLPWSLPSNTTLCDTHHTSLNSTGQKAAWIQFASSGRQELLWITLRVREQFLAHLINCRCIDKAKVSETFVTKHGSYFLFLKTYDYMLPLLPQGLI